MCHHAPPGRLVLHQRGTHAPPALRRHPRGQLARRLRAVPPPARGSVPLLRPRRACRLRPHRPRRRDGAERALGRARRRGTRGTLRGGGAVGARRGAARLRGATARPHHDQPLAQCLLRDPAVGAQPLVLAPRRARARGRPGTRPPAGSGMPAAGQRHPPQLGHPHPRCPRALLAQRAERCALGARGSGALADRDRRDGARRGRP